MSEAQIQGEFHQWLHNNFPETRGLCYHIPNGGSRGKVEAFKFKSIGVIAGIPDYFIAIPRGHYNGMYIEFKSPGEKPRPSQVEIMDKMEKQGYCVVVCDNAENAKQEFLKYYHLQIIQLYYDTNSNNVAIKRGI